MTLKFSELIDILDGLYPPEYAEEWDNVGIQFGSRNGKVSRIMTALDVRSNTVEEAIKNDIDTIVVHHPLLFNPIQSFDYDQPQIETYRQLIKHDIKVFALHTNFDKAHHGMNDWLAQALDLQDIEDLSGPDKEGAPGLGRIGQLKDPMERQELLNYIQERLASQHLTVIESKSRPSYQKIAIVGGSGFEYIYDALDKGADIFITGDITFHKGQEAYDLDIMTLDAGHYIEHIFIKQMAKILKEHLPKDIDIIESQSSTNPFTHN